MPRSSSRFQFSERFNRWRTVVNPVHGDHIDTLCLHGCNESLYCEDLLVRTSCQCLSLVYNLNTYFLELGRQTLATYAEAERVFSVRRNEGGGKDYYIKWRNLSYCEATWEDEFNVTNYYQVRIVKGTVSDFSINSPNTFQNKCHP